MFYEQLKKACKLNGTTVTAVLKRIGVSTANGTFWKNGSAPSSDVVVQLSKLLNVSTDYLLKGEEIYGENSNINFNNTEKETSRESDNDEMTDELVKIFKALPVKERTKLMMTVYELEEEYLKKK